MRLINEKRENIETSMMDESEHFPSTLDDNEDQAHAGEKIPAMRRVKKLNQYLKCLQFNIETVAQHQSSNKWILSRCHYSNFFSSP